MFGLFKASNPPTFGDTIWKLILRIVAGFALIFVAPFVVTVAGLVGFRAVTWLIELPFILWYGQ